MMSDGKHRAAAIADPTPREKEAASILAEADTVVANAILECKRLRDLATRQDTVKRRRKWREAEARLHSIVNQRDDLRERIQGALQRI